MEGKPTKHFLPAFLRMLGHIRTRTIAVLLLLTAATLRNNPPRLFDATAAINGNTRGSNPLNRQTSVTRPLKPWTTIHLLSERHSGSKWMTAHLDECFASDEHRIRVVSALSRWKHWFQENGAYSSRNSIVVAQFRHVNQWVEAMRVNPYHAPNHFNLTWKDFVTREWSMERYGRDRELFEQHHNDSFHRELWNEPSCQYRFRPYQAIPCHENATIKVPGYRHVNALYELRNDGSGLPYDNILQLRADKIRNFIITANFVNVKHLEIVRYEEMAENGTAPLIHKLEQVLGVSAQCRPTDPQPSASRRPLDPDYVEYMRRHVDWDTERLIGYEPE